jgi:hypothetical protein
MEQSNIYQFKITLLNTKPPIWRRIQVLENYSFWELHVAIQDAMGWYDCHLHVFRFTAKDRPRDYIEIGMPDPEWDGEPILPDWKTGIKDWFGKKFKRLIYEYDFGDGWQHEIVLEKILPANPGTSYPLCLTGKRSCPPEDCGGVWGYKDLLEILKNPKNKQHEGMIEWLGTDSWDPELFDPKEVEFDDPDSRLITSGILETK